MRLRGLSSRLEVFTVLRSRNFRLFWSGHAVTVVGLQMFNVALAWVIWDLTRSEYLLGLVGLVEAAPALALGLVGGALADKVDLRRLLVMLQAVTAAILGLLVLVVAIELVQVWHLFVVVFVLGVLQVFDQPARQALFPNLVSKEDLMKAVGLNSMVWSGVRIFGPAIAGVTIAVGGALTGRPLAGVAAAFLMTTLGYGVYGYFLSLIRIPPIQRSTGKNMVRDIAAGLAFIWRRRILATLMVLSFLDVLTVAAYMTLLPVFATDILGGNAIFGADSITLGALYTTSGIGGLSGALIAANLASFRRRGWLILGGGLMQAASVALFALSQSLPLSLLLVMLASVSNAIFSVSIQSTIQAMLPGEFRGRVMSVWSMRFSLFHPLGRLQIGAVAGVSRDYLPLTFGRLAGAPSAILLSAGFMATVAILVALVVPMVRRLDAKEIAGIHESIS